MLFGSNDLWIFFFWVLLNRAPTLTQLHPPPSSSLQHPQQYLNQNVVLNWAISPNLGRKIKNCPFRLQIGTYGILEVLILNPDLDFWNSDSKIHFGQIWAQKFKIVCFVWKLVYTVSQGCWFRIKTEIFEILNPKSIFEQIWVQKSKVVRFFWKLVHMVSQGCWFLFQISLLNFKSQFPFWTNLGQKSQSCPF